MPQVDIQLGASPLFALLALGLAALLAYLYYRTTLPPISGSRRWLLLVLRGTTLAFLLLLLLEPIVRVVSTTSHPPVLTVLIDNSKSLSMTDALGHRPTIVRTVLGAPVIQRIADFANVRYAAFGIAARDVDPDSLAVLGFSDDGTDLASAIRSYSAGSATLRSNALLVISDGVSTIGQNPVHGAEGYGIPLYTVGIGDTTEQRDVAITDVSTNAVVYSGVSTPVDVILKSSGYPGRQVEITLANNSTILDRAQLVLQDGTREYAVRLSYIPEADGIQSYVIHVSSLPEELTEKNNTHTFAVRVRKSKLRILMVAGIPSPDVAVLRQTLGEVDQFSIQSFTQTPTGDFYEGSLAAQAADSADCLILLGFPTRTTRAAVSDMLVSTIQTRRLPVLIQVSKSTDVSQLDRWANVLPFVIQGSPSAEYEATVDAAELERLTPVLTPEYPEGSDPWAQLPPLFSMRLPLRVRPDAVVHATTRARGQMSAEPVIISRRAQRQRVMAFVLHGLWRWRLMAQRSPSTQTFFSAFLSNAVHWLTTPDESGPVIARPVKESFAQGEPMVFRAEVYDTRQRPVDDAEVRIVVRRGGQGVAGLLLPRGNGRYEGETPGLHTDGAATYRVTATKAGSISGSDSGQVQVSGTAIEFLHTRMDSDVLRQLALRTGGVFLRPESVGDLDSLLTIQPSFAPHMTTSAYELHFRSWPWYAALIVILLAVEWILRKRSGMI